MKKTPKKEEKEKRRWWLLLLLLGFAGLLAAFWRYLFPKKEATPTPQVAAAVVSETPQPTGSPPSSVVGDFAAVDFNSGDFFTGTT